MEKAGKDIYVKTKIVEEKHLFLTIHTMPVNPI